MQAGPAPAFVPLICYEIIFPGAVIRDNRRPSWLLNATNDAWFGPTSGPYQHLHQARVRAVEEGLPVIRAANTGVSAVIDAHGRLRAALALGEKGVIDAGLPIALEGTLYGRFHYWILLAISGLALIIISNKIKS
jgi:apolipoprotein N-acyltransferase